MRERKKSSVAGQANSTAELPENSPYWKSNLEFTPSAITPKTSVYAGSGDSSGTTPYFVRMQAIGELAGFHVFEGTTKRHRKRGPTQKEVDVQIAVDLLTNSFKGNMEFATLLAGDQDFRPVVEAVVREGMYITLWTERNSSSQRLRAAADARDYLEWHQLNSFIAKDFERPYTLPTFGYFGGVRLTSAVAEARSGDGSDYIMYEDSGRFFAISVRADDSGRLCHYIHTERQQLERALKIICGIETWRPFSGELPLAIGSI